MSTVYVVRVYDWDLRTVAQYEYDSKERAAERAARVRRMYRDYAVCTTEY